MSQQQIEQELRQIKHESFFAECVRRNPKESIQMIKDQAKDNRVVVVSIIGEKLVSVIEQM
jgi:nitrogen regulatory protein PII-like uncharacterized protein